MRMICFWERLDKSYMRCIIAQVTKHPRGVRGLEGEVSFDFEEVPNGFDLDVHRRDQPEKIGDRKLIDHVVVHQAEVEEKEIEHHRSHTWANQRKASYRLLFSVFPMDKCAEIFVTAHDSVSQLAKQYLQRDKKCRHIKHACPRDLSMEVVLKAQIQTDKRNPKKRQDRYHDPQCWASLRCHTMFKHTFETQDKLDKDQQNRCRGE